jgi:hypothetical protein
MSNRYAYFFKNKTQYKTVMEFLSFSVNNKKMLANIIVYGIISSIKNFYNIESYNLTYSYTILSIIAFLLTFYSISSFNFYNKNYEEMTALKSKLFTLAHDIKVTLDTTFIDEPNRHQIKRYYSNLFFNNINMLYVNCCLLLSNKFRQSVMTKLNDIILEKDINESKHKISAHEASIEEATKYIKYRIILKKKEDILKFIEYINDNKCYEVVKNKFKLSISNPIEIDKNYKRIDEPNKDSNLLNIDTTDDETLVSIILKLNRTNTDNKILIEEILDNNQIDDYNILCLPEIKYEFENNNNDHEIMDNEIDNEIIDLLAAKKVDLLATNMNVSIIKKNDINEIEI